MGRVKKGLLFFFGASGMALVLFRCNIEVGNPESETPGPMRSAQSFSLNLTAMTPCESGSAPCTSVPIVTGDPADSLKFELSQINLGIAGVTFKPLPEEPVATTVDLLRGAVVDVKNSLNTLNMSALELHFSTANGKNTSAMEIAGTITGIWSGERLRIPLHLSYKPDFLGEVPVLQEDALLEGVLFDPNVWFDFAATGNDSFYRLLKGATSGACRQTDALSCDQYRDNLARQISMKISRSMSVKTKANTGKPADKKIVR